MTTGPYSEAVASVRRCATCGDPVVGDGCSRCALIGPRHPDGAGYPSGSDGERGVVAADEPLVGPPPPRRWLAPAIAAAVLLVIAVGVTVRSGGRVSGPDSAGANVSVATPPTTATTATTASATTGAPAASTTPVPAPTATTTTASTTRTTTTTTTTRVARVGDGEPLLGDPLALSLYAAHPATVSEPAYLERVNVDDGTRTRIPYPNVEGIRQMTVVGNELVVVGEDISAIGPDGTRLILGGQGFERSLQNEIASMVVTDHGNTVLRMVNVRDRSAPVDVPLPDGTTRAYSDGTGMGIVYGKPGGGVLRKSTTGTDEPQNAGFGELRAGGVDRFQEATCAKGPCRLTLHPLTDDKVQVLLEGKAALDTVGVTDKINNYVWMATAPSASDGTSAVLRLSDGRRWSIPIVLAPMANCTIEPCPASPPVWSDGGEVLFGVGADHHVFAWRAGWGEAPQHLPDLGAVTAVAVGEAHAGPNAPG